MNVGKLSREIGVPVATLHYYEEIGLVVPGRQDNGYRFYGETAIHKVRFIHRARSLGFSVEDCRTLLSLYEDENRASADVNALCQEHLTEIERKILELESLRTVLLELLAGCRKDERPDCPILANLAGETDASSH